MPQVFHVICCYDCQTLQVHQVKKNPKWACKMCGAKQSLKKVYGCGSGADCRKLVQSLNLQKRNAQEPCDDTDTYTVAETLGYEDGGAELNQMTSSSKWNQFLDEVNESSSLDAGIKNVDEDLMFTTDRDVMLREERELKKLQRQEWKAGKKKIISRSMPYKAKQHSVMGKTSTFNSITEKHNSYRDVHQELESRVKQDFSKNLSPSISLDRKEMIKGNQMRFQNEILKNINSKKDASDMSSKWSQFLDMNQDDNDSESDDLESSEQTSLNVENSMVNSNSINKRSVTRLDKGKENNVTVNDHFNLNIDIDEAFGDW